MFNSIGCFYSYERTAIVKSKITEGKIYLECESSNHIGIKEIGDKLKNFDKDCIVINKHQPLNSYFNYELTEIDFKDNDINEELNDLYKSLESENVLVIDESVDMKLSHHKKALFMAIKGLNYYERKRGIAFASIRIW